MVGEVECFSRSRREGAVDTVLSDSFLHHDSANDRNCRGGVYLSRAEGLGGGEGGGVGKCRHTIWYCFS